MSPLHARTKFMECILKISYCLPDGRSNYGTRDPARKRAKKSKQREIKKEFRRRLGLKVDHVRRNMGTSNEGNTSRRFFAELLIVAEITGVDEALLRRFSTILNAINCTQQLNADKFSEFCIETARNFVALCDWYPMPNTVHKIRLQGAEIVSDASLPIGMLSEEAQEAQNKVYRERRRFYARNTSRIATNADVFQAMFAFSDPLINNFRKEVELDTNTVDESVLPLLDGYESEDSSSEWNNIAILGQSFSSIGSWFSD